MNQDNHKELESIKYTDIIGDYQPTRELSSEGINELDALLSRTITISKEIPQDTPLQLKDQWFDVSGEKFYYSLGEMKLLLEAYIALREREAYEKGYVEGFQSSAEGWNGEWPGSSDEEILARLKKGEE